MQNGGELLCKKISGRRINTLDEHSAFLEEGGCKKVINHLSRV